VEHTHAPDHSETEIRIAAQKLVETATQTTQSTANVLTSVLEDAAEVKSSLPEIRSLKRKIQRTRSKKFTVVNPTSLGELIVTDEYRHLRNGVKFLLFDSGPESENRVLIFGTEKNISTLKTCKHWYSDGTFKSCPKLFYQFFTILGQKQESIIPLLFCLMENKTEKCYDNVYDNRLPISSISL